MNQRMRHLVLPDPVTGVREELGAIGTKKVIDGITVYLTYTEPVRGVPTARGLVGDKPGMWWIVFQADLRTYKIGFVIEHRVRCWEVFQALDARELAKLRAA